LRAAFRSHKGITAPIVGCSKVELIEDAVAAVDLKLNTSDIECPEAKYKPHPVIGHE
jgi:aryl-alcohol dehydrogenase-like predicted oxidoreductase